MATYLISGTAQTACRIRLFNETDDEYLGYEDLSAGNYTVKFRLNSQQDIMIAAEKSDGESRAYGKVTPIVSEGGTTLTPAEIWDEKDGNFTASNGDKLLLDSSVDGFTVTLPASPVMGDTVSFVDAVGNCGTKNVIIGRNGEKIMALDENLTVETDNASFDLVYFNSTYGWRLRYE